MSDRFLDEVNRMHKMRRRFLQLPPHVKKLAPDKFGDQASDDWIFCARDAQLPPGDLDWCWLFLGGRGAGKSHAMSGAVHTAIRAGIKRIHLMPPTTADFHDVNLEGHSGILATSGNDPRPRWISSKRRLEWPNGAMLVFFSGEEPDSLRGPQCELAIIDEIGRMRYQQAVFDMMMLGLRLGDKPRVLLATTPRTTPFMKKLVAMENIRLTSGSTYDNARHLAPDFLARVKELYEGTRLGRQELQGAMILDPANALFKDEWIIRDDIPEEMIEQVSVGVDPSGGGDDIGVIVTALLTDGKFGVLADRTTTGSPATWGEVVVKAHDDFDADDVVVEINFGGVMAGQPNLSVLVDRFHDRLHVVVRPHQHSVAGVAGKFVTT